MFWIVCAVLTLAIVAMVLAPMLRPTETVVADDPQVAIYKAQLEEVERDVARDVLSVEDAERAKAEIARRLIAASETKSRTSQSPIARSSSVLLALGLIVGTGMTYYLLGAPGYPDLPMQTRIALGDEARANRPSQAAFEEAAPTLTPPDVPSDYLASVEQLRTLVPLRGDDLQGWELLAYHEAQLRNYAAAAAAQSKVVEIKAAEATTDDLIRHADLLVTAANGFVSPEAEEVVREILAINPDSIAARYYLGTLFYQTDRPDRAFQLWRSILESGASESFHVTMARRQIGDAAFRTGIDYTPPPPNGPSLEDIQAAEDLDPEARTAMIEGMVASLSDRLATQGGSVTEWARLITAYGVLGQTDDAKEILAEARDVFGASEEAMGILDDAEARAGLTE